MPTHYHVVNNTDPTHQTTGFTVADVAREEAADLHHITRDVHTVIECTHPDCELVTSTHTGGPGDFGE